MQPTSLSPSADADPLHPSFSTFNLNGTINWGVNGCIPKPSFKLRIFVCLFDLVNDPMIKQVSAIDCISVFPNEFYNIFTEAYGVKKIDGSILWRFRILKSEPSDFTTVGVDQLGFSINTALFQLNSNGFFVDFSEERIQYGTFEILTALTSAISICIALISLVFPKEIQADSKRTFLGSKLAQYIQHLFRKEENQPMKSNESHV